MWTNLQFPVDLIIFTKKILNGKLDFLCSDTLTNLQLKVSSLFKYRWSLVGNRRWRINSSKAATGDIVKKILFLKISQILQENTCAGVSF